MIKYLRHTLGTRLFGDTRILDMWPLLKTSPILTQFDWSPLIRSAFMKNLNLLLPTPWSPSIWIWNRVPPYISVDQSDERLPGLLVLHIRRGDFVQHCTSLANWSSHWNGFNSFPEMVDQFTPPYNPIAGETTPENSAVYLKHCLPSIEQIVEKVTEVQKTEKGLTNIYVMTNAVPAWLDELKVALKRAYDWKQIASTKDLKLNWEQEYVSHALDMMIGERAQVFIGNGVRSPFLFWDSLLTNLVAVFESHIQPCHAAYGQRHTTGDEPFLVAAFLLQHWVCPYLPTTTYSKRTIIIHTLVILTNKEGCSSFSERTLLCYSH